MWTLVPSPGSLSIREPAAVALDDMLDDRQAEAGAAERAASARVDPVEALGHPRDMLGGDALALVGDGELDHPALARERRPRPAFRAGRSAARC